MGVLSGGGLAAVGLAWVGAASDGAQPVPSKDKSNKKKKVNCIGVCFEDTVDPPNCTRAKSMERGTYFPGSIVGLFEEKCNPPNPPYGGQCC